MNFFNTDEFVSNLEIVNSIEIYQFGTQFCVCLSLNVSHKKTSTTSALPF